MYTVHCMYFVYEAVRKTCFLVDRRICIFKAWTVTEQRLTRETVDFDHSYHERNDENTTKTELRKVKIYQEINAILVPYTI